MSYLIESCLEAKILHSILLWTFTVWSIKFSMNQARPRKMQLRRQSSNFYTPETSHIFIWHLRQPKIQERDTQHTDSWSSRKIHLKVRRTITTPELPKTYVNWNTPSTSFEQASFSKSELGTTPFLENMMRKKGRREGKRERGKEEGKTASE